MKSFGIELSDQEFQAFSDLVRAKAGINLHAGKKELVRSRLARRIRERNLETFNDYYQYIMDDASGDELVVLLDSIATNLTQFFREPKHFEFMAETFLPDQEKTAVKENRSVLRIWSAGCSTGEEPYSIAMTVLEYLAEKPDWEVKILGTDLSTKVLGTAWQGVYSWDRVSGIASARLRRFFQQGRDRSSGLYRIKDDVKKLVTFRRMNLNEPFPMKKPFDLIFCRNVMIYFDKPTQAALVDRFHQALNKGGYLFIGHSESLSGIAHPFKYVKPTIYRK